MVHVSASFQKFLFLTSPYHHFNQIQFMPGPVRKVHVHYKKLQNKLIFQLMEGEIINAVLA